MPPKPSDKQKALAFYNIDFSLSNQMRLAGQSPAASSSLSSLAGGSQQQQKDPIQRKKEFIKRRRCQADEDGASKVIQAMSKMANSKSTQESLENEEIERASRPAISWKVFVNIRW